MNLSSGKSIKNVAGTALLTEAGALDNVALGSSVTGNKGAWVKLGDTVVATGEGTIDVGTSAYITSTYRVYKIIGSNIHVSDDGVYGNLRVLVGGVIDSAAGTQYHGVAFAGYDTSSTLTVNNQSLNYWSRIFGQSCGNADYESSNVEVTLYDPTATDTYKHITCQSSSTDLDVSVMNRITTGFWKGTAAVTGLSFYAASGYINSGYFTLYGLVT
jgi:hypothetical protein